MNNYELCSSLVIERLPTSDCTVLDFGCGRGEIVNLLRQRGVRAFGCDVFYEASSAREQIDRSLLDAGVIRSMEGSQIPFENERFDIVVTNQVMEHVENLDSALLDIKRVLKPGGYVLSIFPDKGVWVEPHCGTPFLHWYKKANPVRPYHAWMFRMMGFGYNKDPRLSWMQWSRHFCDFIDRWTYYRSYGELVSTYDLYFTKREHVEDRYLLLKAGRLSWIAKMMPRQLRGKLGRKFGGLAFWCSKSSI